MSITQEIEKKTQKNWRIKKIGIIFFLLILGWVSTAYFFFASTIEKAPPQKETIYVVKKGDIRISIAGEGKIIADDTLDLQFKIADKIKSIFKKPGDLVFPGEKLAELESDFLQINVDKAKIALEQAKSILASKKEPRTVEEKLLYEEQRNASKIGYELAKIQGEIDVANAKIAMDNAALTIKILEIELGVQTGNANLPLLEEQEQKNILQQQEDAMLQIWQTIPILENALYDIDTLFGISTKNQQQNDGFEMYLSAKDTKNKNDTQRARAIADNMFTTFLPRRKNYRNKPDFSEISWYLTELVAITKTVNESVQYTILGLKASVSAENFSEQTIDWYITRLEATTISLKKAIHDLITTKQNIDSAKQTLQTKVWTVINETQNKLLIAENEYTKTKIQYENAQKKASWSAESAAKQVDMTNTTIAIQEQWLPATEERIYTLAIQQAEKNLLEAEKKLTDTILVSPTTGTILAINGYVWEIMQTNTQIPFVQLSVAGTQYIESFVEEADVLKIHKGQKAVITIDAVEWISFSGEVFFVADTGIADTNGIITYKVLIQYKPPAVLVKNGMGVEIAYITKEVENIRIIPVKSVLSLNGKPNVKMKDGSYKQITPWLTDTKMVAVLSWLTGSDQILISQ